MRNKNKKVSLAKKPFLVLSRRAIAGWLVAIFFVCAWMFAIGVLVGRGTAPVKFDIAELQRKLAAAGANLKEAGPEDPRKEPEIAKDKTELEFYEALKKDREDTEIPEVPSSPTMKKEMEAPPAEKPSPKKKVSLKRLTRTRPKVAQKAQPPRAEPATKSYTIQVAAFKAVGDADKLVAELKQKGFSAYRKITKIPDKGIWYRVRVGAYHSKAEARKTLANLKGIGMQGVLVAE